ncbi:MAG: response regulator [Promethearchaeota archaeon]
MKRYERETGKKAVWRDRITDSFKKWSKGEKIYSRDKERIALYVSEDDKMKWVDFTEKKGNLTISRLIRLAVNFYIDINNAIPDFESFSKISHDLKEPLTSIKGFAQLLIENYKEQLGSDILFKLKEILEKSDILEKKITETLEIDKIPALQYDILIIDDDSSTIELLTSFLSFHKFNVKAIKPENPNLIEEIYNYRPRMILLDVILPVVSGYDLCKQIKQDEKLKETLVYFITAIPKYEISAKLEETNADGFFLKPFELKHLKNEASKLLGKEI